MNVLVFDLKGKFAHFRKFYTNSSSMSYLFPPRTTLMGVVASILGIERDSYYDLLSSENLYITARVMFKPRRIMQTLNYMKVENPNGVFAVKDHTQVPFEIIAAQDNNVVYRVYLRHRCKDIYEEIKHRVCCGKCEYPIYLGAAPFSANIEYVGEYQGEYIQGEGDIVTPINKDYIKDIKFNYDDMVLVRERVPRDFFEDRMIKEAATYIFEERGKDLKVSLNCDFVRLENGENIVFM
ncbi:type I-B CRISPR-associated protein Cas5b [Fonticella tunisiensis]|uniref:CRISPR-associated Cas5h family protein n=1 Tax=Fonticella tunisiensis TaxID=1096341 RepID=A0A4R7KAP0_9CLOT|nr:type I-B CRISPR-associated protein Cas5b [Fonticella tunisiensis]TDT51934.1 CRISPR-associated Cas5h family protein [Fonticella tunisiensis]